MIVLLPLAWSVCYFGQAAQAPIILFSFATLCGIRSWAQMHRLLDCCAALLICSLKDSKTRIHTNAHTCMQAYHTRKRFLILLLKYYSKYMYESGLQPHISLETANYSWLSNGNIQIIIYGWSGNEKGKLRYNYLEHIVNLLSSIIRIILNHTVLTFFTLCLHIFFKPVALGSIDQVTQ